MKYISTILAAFCLLIANGPVFAVPGDNTVPEHRPYEHKITGKIVGMANNLLTLETRNQELVKVDASDAVKNYKSAVLYLGGLIAAHGAYDGSSGLFNAELILRAKSLDQGLPDY